VESEFPNKKVGFFSLPEKVVEMVLLFTGVERKKRLVGGSDGLG
jgi:hypothetical protein